jgi:hypothetical protein
MSVTPDFHNAARLRAGPGCERNRRSKGTLRLYWSSNAGRNEDGAGRILVFEAPGFESPAMSSAAGREAGRDDGCELSRCSHVAIRCRRITRYGEARFLRIHDRAA